MTACFVSQTTPFVVQSLCISYHYHKLALSDTARRCRFIQSIPCDCRRILLQLKPAGPSQCIQHSCGNRLDTNPHSIRWLSWLMLLLALNNRTNFCGSLQSILHHQDRRSVAFLLTCSIGVCTNGVCLCLHCGATICLQRCMWVLTSSLVPLPLGYVPFVSVGLLIRQTCIEMCSQV